MHTAAWGLMGCRHPEGLWCTSVQYMVWGMGPNFGTNQRAKGHPEGLLLVVPQCLRSDVRVLSWFQETLVGDVCAALQLILS